MELKLNNQFTNLSIKEMDEVNGGLALGWYIVGGVVLVGMVYGYLFLKKKD